MKNPWKLISELSVFFPAEKLSSIAKPPYPAKVSLEISELDKLDLTIAAKGQKMPEFKEFTVYETDKLTGLSCMKATCISYTCFDDGSNDVEEPFSRYKGFTASYLKAYASLASAELAIMSIMLDETCYIRGYWFGWNSQRQNEGYILSGNCGPIKKENRDFLLNMITKRFINFMTKGDGLIENDDNGLLTFNEHPEYYAFGYYLRKG